MSVRRSIRVFERLFWLGVVLAGMFPWAKISAGDFPAVSELPSHPELPDPLVMFDGTPVTTPAQWYKHRRPELKRLFQHYMYGYQPDAPEIIATRRVDDAPVLGGKGTLRQVEIRFQGLDSANAPKLHLAIVLPATRKSPAPVFLALNKCGNEHVIADEAVLVDPSAWQHEQCPPAETAAGRGNEADFWDVAYLIERGYAFATIHESDIDPDRDDFTDGVHPHFPNVAGPPEARWGTIAAWAWGLSRCVDYLVTDPDINSKQIAVTGHSRRGKTALLAGAFDERIALVVPHQSGTGGAALSRDNDQETVERINRVFPHWFNDVYPQFGSGNEAKLPIDQHLLMALVAPRPLLETAGLEDKWANYDSAYRSLQAADVVYKFLGARGIVGTGMAVQDDATNGDGVGELLQYRRDDKHTLNHGYWVKILDFADGQFGRDGKE